ncbi:MAG: ParB/RepB/Spo0J family partition protein [Gammaproteobacteria bacterium]|nr:ParB/RepB/Spo0J family partition protein [Gammaproteobacteria bacterium]
MSGLADLKRHPLSAIWGDMPDREFRDLVADVEEAGIQEPIVLYEGKVLDGWHRTRAAIAAGLSSVPATEFDPDRHGDPKRFVMRKNGLRRHLKAGERARAVVELFEWRPRGRPSLNDSNESVSESEMAQAVNVSRSTIQRAKRQSRKARGEPDVRPPSRKGYKTKQDRIEELEFQLDGKKHRIAELEAKLGSALSDACPDVMAENDRLRAENRELSDQVFRLNRKAKGGAT